MTPLVRELSRIIDHPEKSHWFDLGNVGSHVDWENDPERLLHLPFDDIILVGIAGPDKFCIRASFRSDNVAVAGFWLTPKMLQIAPFAYCEHEGNLKIIYTDDKQKQAARASLALLDTLLTRLEAPQTAFRMQAKDSFTSRRKIAQGKPPQYSWTTVEVKPRQKGEGNGTHASPRAHDRRGHWRSLPKGKVWVKPCKVGDASKGTVFHDYKVAA
jgi:hypothetical protein